MFTQIGIIESQLDYDAINFCSAAGITDQTQVLALHYFVSNMKLSGLWTKCKAIYPFVGGTASTHKWNLKDPRDLDAAFRLVFNGGGWTHSSNGALPNGTSSWANTFMTPNGNISQNSGHISLYSRTNSLNTALMVDVGNEDADNAAFYFSTYYSNNYPGVISNINGSGFGSYGNNTRTDGFFLSQRIGSAETLIYRNNTQVHTHYNTSTTPVSSNIILSAHRGTKTEFSNKQLAFVSLGESFTREEVTTYSSIVAQYQTILGRNV